MTKDEFKTMGTNERSDWLRQNFPAGKQSLWRRKNRKIYGKGINDADYQTWVKINEDILYCPIYYLWRGIIYRTTNHFQNIVGIYAGTTLDPRWISFMAFRAWFIPRYKEDYQVDKDLISDTRVYGPDTCVMVPNWLNSFLSGPTMKTPNQKSVGSTLLPSGKYGSEFGDLSLGSFNTQRQAHYAWRKAKRQYAKSRRAEMDAIDIRIYPRIILRLKGL